MFFPVWANGLPSVYSIAAYNRPELGVLYIIWCNWDNGMKWRNISSMPLLSPPLMLRREQLITPIWLTLMWLLIHFQICCIYVLRNINTLILGQDGAWNLDNYQLRTATMLSKLLTTCLLVKRIFCLKSSSLNHVPEDVQYHDFFHILTRISSMRFVDAIEIVISLTKCMG